jgi:peptidoglycan/LPS O-acetylase OafA/YrhL
MFEISRYILALIVANTHLSPISLGWTGWQAVFGFYTLSGYLMTRVLHERYGFAWSGIAAFFANRVLRLWPAYLVVVFVTWALLCVHPLQNFFFSLTWPHTFLERVTLITILGQVSFDFRYLIPLSRLAPTSWSLSIEVFCYCLLALYFAKTPKRLVALALLGMVGIASSTGYCWAGNVAGYGSYCFQNRYGVIQAGFIPFAAGGLVYFHRAAMWSSLVRWWPWLIAILVGAETAVALSLFVAVTIGPFLGAVLMLMLIVWDGGDKRATRTGDFFGRASYHLFIAHMSIAAVLVVVFKVTPNSVSVFLMSVGLALALSAVLVPLELRLNRLRNRVSRWGRRADQTVAPSEGEAVPALGRIHPVG